MILGNDIIQMFLKRSLASQLDLLQAVTSTMANIEFLIALVIASLVSMTWGQVQSIGCFEEGECIQSVSLGFNRTSSPQECLQYCQVRIM